MSGSHPDSTSQPGNNTSLSPESSVTSISTTPTTRRLFNYPTRTGQSRATSHARNHRQKEMDLEKVYNAMEKGHKVGFFMNIYSSTFFPQVCKLLLLKKWDPSYKKLSFNRDTRQIILSKYDGSSSAAATSRAAAAAVSASNSSKNSILDLRLVKEAHTLQFKLHTIQIQDKWKKDKDVQRFDSEMILVISFGSLFVFNHWILLCKFIDKFVFAFF